MKKIIFALSLLLLCSCSYLDVVPEGKATEEDIWKTEEQAENYRYYMQTYMPNLIGYDWSPDQFAGDDFITGARGTTYYFSSKSLLYGEENANLTYFGRWAPNCTSGGTNYDIYRGIRYCFYLLDNIYKVPAVSQENADRYAGEAWFLVGYYHQCLLEYYGPIVLVKKFIPIDAPESEILTPRTPYDECVKYIAECYDRAAGLLPDVVGESELGLPTKMAALSYKARLLLYAASPLVNGNPDYIGFNNPDGTPLMSTTYDPEKWKRALDAAAAAIALADEINPDTKKPKYDLYTSADSSLPDDERGRKNYHDTFVEEPWNGAEFILAKGAQSGIQALQRYGGPRSIKGNMSKGWKTTLVPTMEAVEMYYTKNGLPLDVDPLTKDEDLYSVAPPAPQPRTPLLRLDRFRPRHVRDRRQNPHAPAPRRRTARLDAQGDRRIPELHGLPLPEMDSQIKHLQPVEELLQLPQIRLSLPAASGTVLQLRRSGLRIQRVAEPLEPRIPQPGAQTLRAAPLPGFVGLGGRHSLGQRTAQGAAPGAFDRIPVRRTPFPRPAPLEGGSRGDEQGTPLVEPGRQDPGGFLPGDPGQSGRPRPRLRSAEELLAGHSHEPDQQESQPGAEPRLLTHCHTPNNKIKR